ncbi:MAG: ABC transporter permease [Acidobacteria bacterium]|nr:ABC transporter permease [Acidobacteriota bacterium]
MRLYRLLLHAYPASFRAAHGDEMAAIVRARLRAAHGFARVPVWLAVVGELIVNAPAVHWDLLRQDVGYAARTLYRSPGFALTVIVVAALGIGANTVAFSVADFVLVRPLSFPEPDRLVRLCEGPRRGGGWGCNNELSPANYRDFKVMSSSFAAMGAFGNGAMNLVGAGEPRRLSTSPVTSEVLPLLGVTPLMGRVFRQGNAEDRNAAVISFGLWHSQFAGAPDVLGRKITLDGAPYTIIGVMPSGFYFPNRDIQLWTPLPLEGDDFADRTDNYIEAIGRLKPNVTFDRARAELTTIADRLAHDYPETNADTGISFFRLADNMSPRARLTLVTLSGASACLLLLTCANLASLLLARAAARRRELAVRAALGAGRERLVRQLITETVVLTTIGGAAGVLMAAAAVPWFSTLVPSTLPMSTRPTLDLRVLSIAAAFTAATALGFGVFPAIRASRTGFAVLRGGTRSGDRTQRVRAGLVTVEIAMSMVLLIAAGLLIRTVWRVQTIDPGFAADHVLTLETALPRPKYAGAIRRTEFYQRVLTSVRALPGVESAAFTSGLPMIVTGFVTGLDVPGRDPQATRNEAVSHRWITPRYFATMGIPLRRGRDVEDTDTREGAWVAVVSESFAERYWPGQDAIGKTFRHRGDIRTVVGVVGNVRVRGLERASEPQMYLPAQQIANGQPANFDPKDLVVRHAGAEPSIVSAIRQIVHAADPEQPVSEIRTMDDVLASETAGRRAQLRVLGVLAAVAILLSGVGIYGLLAYTVAQRSREIGVRLALGARPARVGRMIFADGLRLAVLGMALGVPAAYVLARSMSALLFGITPGDPATFATGAGIVMLIATAGSLVPALKATKVTPVTVLRVE